MILYFSVEDKVLYSRVEYKVIYSRVQNKVLCSRVKDIYIYKDLVTHKDIHTYINGVWFPTPGLRIRFPPG